MKNVIITITIIIIITITATVMDDSTIQVLKKMRAYLPVYLRVCLFA